MATASGGNSGSRSIGRRKKSAAFQDLLYPRRQYPRGRYEYEYDDDWISVVVPPQPSKILPSPKHFIPRKLRRNVYELLLNWFPKGIDVSTLCQAYNKRHGAPLSTMKECNMTMGEAFRLMADIVDVGIADGKVTWVRPVPYKMVKTLCSEEELLELELQEYDALGITEDSVQRQKEAEAEDHRPIPEQIRSELKTLVEPYTDGINIENLAVMYSVLFPKRGVTLEEHPMLKEWLVTSPDLVEVYENDVDGKKCIYVKPRSG